MIVSDKGGGDFQLAPVGNHIARCFSVIDLGTQENTLFGGWRRQVFIQWELPDELMEAHNGDEQKPFSIGKFYTASLSEKARLRQDLESWRGRSFTDEELKGFDLQNIIDKPCMLNVIHKVNQKGNTKAEIAGVSPLPKNTGCPALKNPTRHFDLETFDMKVLDEVSEGLQDIVKKSVEWHKRFDGGAKVDETPPSDFADDIPF